MGDGQECGACRRSMRLCECWPEEHLSTWLHPMQRALLRAGATQMRLPVRDTDARMIQNFGVSGVIPDGWSLRYYPPVCAGEALELGDGLRWLVERVDCQRIERTQYMDAAACGAGEPDTLENGTERMINIMSDFRERWRVMHGTQHDAGWCWVFTGAWHTGNF